MVVERAVPQDEGPSGVVRVGVIGLGSMGFGMAQSLRGAGFHVAGYDVSEFHRCALYCRRRARRAKSGSGCA